MKGEPTDLDPDRSDDIDAPTDHLEPLSGSALDRELHTLFGTDDEAEGRRTASPTTGHRRAPSEKDKVPLYCWKWNFLSSQPSCRTSCKRSLAS